MYKYKPKTNATQNICVPQQLLLRTGLLSAFFFGGGITRVLISDLIYFQLTRSPTIAIP